MSAKAKKIGRPTKRTPDVIERILAGLSQGIPLTIICEPDDMPETRTVYDWLNADEELSAHFARAREAGFDRIAMDALAIADQVDERDTISSEKGDYPNKEWIMRSKLRVDTRLKLLSKWDPKRYGERLALAGEEGAPVRISVLPEDAAL